MGKTQAEQCALDIQTDKLYQEGVYAILGADKVCIFKDGSLFLNVEGKECLSDQVMALVAPYLDIVRAFNPHRDLTAYPGSPLVTRALLRPQDRLVACELEPNTRRKHISGWPRDGSGRFIRTHPPGGCAGGG